MASFTDAITQFNPYVQQLPLEAMAQVGMFKQAKYEENVQKIQGQLEKIAGLDIYRPNDRAYLQSKLNELGGKLKTVAGGDFSNFQLVNSVGGMASQIGKDPLVQSAVSSTVYLRKQEERIQKAIDEGKSSPDNIYKFNKAKSSWLNSPEVGASFNTPYKPFFDIFKHAKETFDAILPDNYTFDQIFELDKNGKPVVIKDKNGKESLVYSTTMTRLEREGRFPKKVQETISQIFSDPRVSEQLQITGEYNYRGYDDKALASRLIDQKEQVKESLEERRLDLAVMLRNGQDVQADIDAIDQRLNSIDANYDDYINMVTKDPDAVRGSLYREEMNNRYVTMFGKITNKQEIKENPAWRAQFEMQKEANAQSRWAQTELRQRQEFKDTKDFQREQLQQAWDIAVLNATTRAMTAKGKAGGLGVPDDESRFEQGNQFSSIDVIQLQQRDYENAANDFTTNSAEFIWDGAGFNDVPANKTLLDKLISSGKTSQEAKRTLLAQAAARQKVPLEEFMTRYVNKATKNYQNLTPEQRAKNPSLVDSYNMFTNSQKNFTTARAINQNIDREQEAKFGATSKESNKQLQQVLSGIKEQKVKVYGTEYLVTKDDAYDLALWLKGNLSALGTLGGVDPIMRTAANEAEKRLDARGKGDLISYIREMNPGRRAYRGGLITGALDALRTGIWTIPNIKGATIGLLDYGGADLDNDVNKIFNVIDQKDFAESIKGRADIIKRAYGIKPNLKTGVFTGDSETDKQSLYNIKRWTGEYGTTGGGRINASGDFKDFAKYIGSIKDPAEANISVQPKVASDGAVAVEIIAYDKDDASKRIGGMTIQADEALKVGIDVNTLYESPQISGLRTLINYQKGSTSAGDPKKIETYKQGDAYFKEDDFQGLAGSEYRASGNMIYKNGKYYGFLYVIDNKGKEDVREIPGSPSLALATSALLGIKPIFAEAVLKKY